ncbi:hypothetical protein B9Z19DRAFT_1130500 [Tuber borchii]|uniref:Uncharacterized protein n=1 Tax=Tuber borchii TaxID=42251 RepID=A0A2T6ZKP5_TUBBO|nr:hypothetical protein B9Z19DRAFT_1130500 [Tuber borchii]
MSIISLFALLLFFILPSTTVGHKTATVTVIEPTTTVSFTKFLLPTNHYQSIPRTGPLHTCFQKISTRKSIRKNWFAVAWESGKTLDSLKCDQLQKSIRKNAGKGLSRWRCYWYFDPRTRTGVSKAQGVIKSKVGKMENIIEKAVGGIWGVQGVERCRFI